MQRTSKATLLCLAILCACLAARPAQAAPAPDLSFDLLDSKPAPAPDLTRALQIERQVRARRGLLVAHQVLGIAALVSLGATAVIGHLNYHDKYVSGDFTGRYKLSHLGLSITTTALFGSTGILALAAPNPYPKPVRLDSALVHKVSMALATAGMVTQIILGPLAVARVGRSDQAGLGLGHVITGYATFGFMAAGVISYVF